MLVKLLNLKYREKLLWKKNKLGTKDKNMVATSHMGMLSM